MYNNELSNMDKKQKMSQRRFDQWETNRLHSECDLGDGSYLVASVILCPLGDDDERYDTTIYLERYDDDRLTERKQLKHAAFSNIWDAILYCETVDLGELETTNE